MRDAVIVEAVRTPVAKGKPGGAYADVHPVDLHAHSLRSLVERVPGLDPAEIDDVIGGAVGQVGEQSTNTTRIAALAAGSSWFVIVLVVPATKLCEKSDVQSERRNSVSISAT